MDFAKKIAGKLLFVYLAVFPLGQLARVDVLMFEYKIPIILIDVLSGLFLIIFLLGKYRRPKILESFPVFFLTAAFSLVFSAGLFNSTEIIIGSLYLLRIAANAALFAVICDLIRKKILPKSLVLHSLIATALAVGIFGWLQYLFYPDLRGLIAWGWDDHLNRLVGTFLDPGFTSIILVFGFLLVLARLHLATKRNLAKQWILMLGFLFVSILFTYSRAGYLALISGLVFFYFRKPKILVPVLIIFALGVILLPRPAGEGVKLERTSSVAARLENYRETFEIFKKSPIFGIGLNNMCLAKKVFFAEANTESHACSGSDSSLLLILATTGVVGLFAFVNFVKGALGIRGSYYCRIFLASGLALVVHSQFVNSMFYPWVLGWMACLLALCTTEKTSE